MKRGRGRPRKENVVDGSNTDKSRIRRANLAAEHKQAERNTRRTEKVLLREIDREGVAATIRSVSGPLTVEVRPGEAFDRAYYRAIRKIFLWSKWQEFFQTHRPSHPAKKQK